ncbi:hypothetical protein BD410DRAFT_789528 [Rickenella mellea]|uniref:Uncharacterized protein n=1 Tax=Rickenella mellea TaxID=50990 RepID=A0A4Y7Q3A3_9AGAM|nr:hypothetical protein BD410DRAFT_789528 [Rickenella mellea]
MGLALYTPAIFITDLEVKSIRYVGTATGCNKTAPSRKVVFLLFVLLLISETVMMKVWKIGRRSRLLVTMYRDGLIYYLYIFVISLTNMMVPLVASPDFWFVWITPQRVLHSLFGSRVLLHIWEEITPHEQVILTTNVDRNMSFAEVRSGETGTQSELQADIETNPPT